MTIACAAMLSTTTVKAQVPDVRWDSRSLIIDGRRVVPVMGEIHYSRIPVDEWEREVSKMRTKGYSIGADSVICAAFSRCAARLKCLWCCE